MLRRGEDYAHQRPALTKEKLRELELTAGAKPRTKAAAGIWSTNRAIRDAEWALTEQAEISYRRMVHRPTSRTTIQKSGRERDTGARINHALKGAKLRGRLKAPDVCTSLRPSPAPTNNLTETPTSASDDDRCAKSGENRGSALAGDQPKLTGAVLSPSRPPARPIRPPKNVSAGLDFHRSPNPGPEVGAGFILVHRQNLAALATNLANARERRELPKRETDRVVA
jgi:hypothetical protein